MPAYSVRGEELEKILKNIEESRIDVVRKVAGGCVGDNNEYPCFYIDEPGVPRCGADPKRT